MVQEEIIFSIPAGVGGLAQRVRSLVHEALEAVGTRLELSVPLQACVQVGDSWATLSEV